MSHLEEETQPGSDTSFLTFHPFSKTLLVKWRNLTGGIFKQFIPPNKNWTRNQSKKKNSGVEMCLTAYVISLIYKHIYIYKIFLTGRSDGEESNISLLLP